MSRIANRKLIPLLLKRGRGLLAPGQCGYALETSTQHLIQLEDGGALLLESCTSYMLDNEGNLLLDNEGNPIPDQ